MRIAVLGSADGWYFKDLSRAAGARHELFAVLWREIHSAVDCDSVRVGSGKIDLREFDAVLVRTMPPGSLEQIIFRMDALAQLEANGLPVVNSARSLEAAIDKYLALARLQRAGLPVPRTAACQTDDDALRSFHALGADVVVKPLFGSEGRGLIRVDDRGLAERTFQLLSQLGAVLYLQEFVHHPGYDIRVLVIGDRLLAMRRHGHGDWRTNVSRGGRAEPIEITDPLASLARRAAAAVGSRLAGVDLLPGPRGELYVIEVNAVPGWKGLARACGVDVAALVLEYLERIVSPDESS